MLLGLLIPSLSLSRFLSHLQSKPFSKYLAKVISLVCVPFQTIMPKRNFSSRFCIIFHLWSRSGKNANTSKTFHTAENTKREREKEKIDKFFHFHSNFVFFSRLTKQGQFFSGSAYRIYLLGNPIIWWSNLVFLAVFVLVFLVSAVKQQRGYKNNLENNGNITIKKGIRTKEHAE